MKHIDPIELAKETLETHKKQEVQNLQSIYLSWMGLEKAFSPENRELMEFLTSEIRRYWQTLEAEKEPGFVAAAAFQNPDLAEYLVDLKRRCLDMASKIEDLFERLEHIDEVEARLKAKLEARLFDRIKQEAPSKIEAEDKILFGHQKGK